MIAGATPLKSASRSSADLFTIEGLRVRELSEADLSLLQDFYVSNPEYFLAVNGIPPREDEAKQEFHSRPPPEIPFERVFVVGFFDTKGALVAMASIDSNFLAMGIWHIALFVVAAALHGSGRAATIYAATETWMAMQGARWVRLGVVSGNIRAEKFWEKSGFVEVRRRSGIVMGICTHTVRVMVKPLTDSDLTEYLDIAQRDRQKSDYKNT